MDPVTIIVCALAAGAAAGLKPTAEKAIKDAYEGLKSLIQREYGNVSVEALEAKPASEAKQASVAEDLADAGASEDPALLDQAKALLDALRVHEQRSDKPYGLDWEEIEAEYLRIKKVTAAGAGTGFRLKKGKLGRAELGEIIAGEPEKKS